MNKDGITKPNYLSGPEKAKLIARLGKENVQFSVTVKQFIQILRLTNDAANNYRQTGREKGWRDSEIAMGCNEAYPVYELGRVMNREKIQRYLKLLNESKNSESTKTD